MRDVIYNLLVKVYGRIYGYTYCDTMTERIADKINNGGVTQGDIMHYLWINTSGGMTAEYVSGKIREAFPTMIEDTLDQSIYR
jgi:hypothetical protein